MKNLLFKLSLQGLSQASFWLAHAVLTSVACCSFLLRISSWYSSPRQISSISSLSFSSKTWLSSFSAISTGCMQVPTSPVIKLLQNRYSSCVAFRDAYTLLTIPSTQQPSDPVRHKGLHHIACPCSSEKSLCFGLRKCSAGQRTLCLIYLFFWVFLECTDLFLPLGQTGSKKRTEYFCSKSSLRLLPFRSSSFSSFSCFFSSFRNSFICCSSARLAVWGSVIQTEAVFLPCCDASWGHRCFFFSMLPSFSFPSLFLALCLSSSAPHQLAACLGNSQKNCLSVFCPEKHDGVIYPQVLLRPCLLYHSPEHPKGSPSTKLAGSSN